MSWRTATSFGIYGLLANHEPIADVARGWRV